MDDGFEFLVGLFFAVLAIIFVIKAIIWFLSVALPFLLMYVVLPGASYAVLGRQFYKQLKSYRLSDKSMAALGIIGAIAILIALVVVSFHELHWLWMAPISVMVFLVAAVPTLAIWAYSKRKDLLDAKEAMNSELNLLQMKIRNNTSQIEEITESNRKIEEKFGVLMHDKKKLEAHLRELCATDARAYSIKRRKWEDKFRKLGDNELRAYKQDLARRLSRVDASDGHRKTEYCIKLGLVILAKLEGTMGKPDRVFEANKVDIEKLSREKASLKQKTADLESRINNNVKQHRQLVEAGIALD